MTDSGAQYSERGYHSIGLAHLWSKSRDASSAPGCAKVSLVRIELKVFAGVVFEHRRSRSLALFLPWHAVTLAAPCLAVLIDPSGHLGLR